MIFILQIFLYVYLFNVYYMNNLSVLFNNGRFSLNFIKKEWSLFNLTLENIANTMITINCSENVRRTKS